MKKFNKYRLVRELIKLAILLVKLAKLVRELLDMASNYPPSQSDPSPNAPTQVELQISA